MTLIQSIILGVVQGITEFLPVSSTGHLVLVPYLLGWRLPADDTFVFDILVQVATLVGVVAYFWHDLAAIIDAMLLGLRERKPFIHPLSQLGWYIFLATLPAGWAGLIFKHTIKRYFDSPFITAIFLLCTAGLLLLAEWLGRRSRSLEKLTWKDALFIGLFQAFALLPGISRSGATITGAMTRDLERTASARFSFLMSIPIMLGAGVVALFESLRLPNLLSLLPVYLPGFATAAVVGYLSIRWLLGFLARQPLYIFAAYCTLISLITIAVVLF